MKDDRTSPTPMPDPLRRALMGAALLVPCLGLRAWAEAITELTWQDLLPEGQPPLPSPLSGLVQHESAALASLQPRSTGLRDDWNGTAVRLPGYIVPLDFDGTLVTTFILVPYVGACIHVPPPPANQLVLVTLNTPYQSSGLFEPVSVTGTLDTHSLSTSLAEIGYSIQADLVEPYKG